MRTVPVCSATYMRESPWRQAIATGLDSPCARDSSERCAAFRFATALARVAAGTINAVHSNAPASDFVNTRRRTRKTLPARSLVMVVQAGSRAAAAWPAARDSAIGPYSAAMQLVAVDHQHQFGRFPRTRPHHLADVPSRGNVDATATRRALPSNVASQ